MYKTNNEWVVKYSKCISGRMTKQYAYELPLHPTDIDFIKECSIVFDNMEGRISSQPDVEFEIIDECAKLVRG
jgi:hypothetical protein